VLGHQCRERCACSLSRRYLHLYLYLSFTDATTFSPTDMMPLTLWATTLMVGPSRISLLTIAPAARVVNILV